MIEFNIEKYWEATLSQNALKMREFFSQNAQIKWHNTNERFNLDEFIEVNCTYPGSWQGEIEKCITCKDVIITVVRVESIDEPISLHVTSFFTIKNKKIISLDEYWGDDGEVPLFRLKKNIGLNIK